MASLASQNIPGKIMRPLFIVAVVFYLTSNMLNGDRGMYAMLKEERKLASLQSELNEVVGKRKDLEHRVRLLSTDSLDRDLLDEQSRIILDTAGEDEVVIPLRK